MIRHSSILRSAPRISQLNIIPLIDVVFQLLVFFMVVSQVVSVEQEEMRLPSPADSQAREKHHADRLIVNLLANTSGRIDRITVNGQVIADLPALVDLLLRQKSTFVLGKTPVILRADKSLHFDQIEPVLKAMSNAGVADVEIATESNTRVGGAM